MHNTLFTIRPVSSKHEGEEATKHSNLKADEQVVYEILVKIIATKNIYTQFPQINLPGIVGNKATPLSGMELDKPEDTLEIIIEPPKQGQPPYWTVMTSSLEINKLSRSMEQLQLLAKRMPALAQEFDVEEDSEEEISAEDLKQVCERTKSLSDLQLIGMLTRVLGDNASVSAVGDSFPRTIKVSGEQAKLYAVNQYLTSKSVDASSETLADLANDPTVSLYSNPLTR